MKALHSGLALGLLMTTCAFGAACGDDTSGPSGGTGKVTFTTWGEEYIEDQIPPETFADGFSITYSKFLVSVGNITIADADGKEAANEPGFFLIDHTEAGVKELVSFDGLEAKAYTKVSYELNTASAADTTKIGKVTDADVTLMTDNQYMVYVEGTLSKDGESKTFKWGFSEPTLLEDCEGEIDGKTTEGVLVTDGGQDVVELTIHGDHPFYDDLQSPDAKVRGQAVFDADANDDGEVTQEELGMVQLVDLPADEYGTGGVDGVNELGSFVSFLSRTVGHYRGEGECFLTDP